MVEELIGGRTCHEYGFRVDIQYLGSDNERVRIVERVVRDFYQGRLPDDLRLHSVSPNGV